MAEEGTGWGKRIALATAIVGLVAAAFTLYANWDSWTLGKQACSISGTFSTWSGEPVRGVDVGWVSASDNTFHKFATTGADGTFEGDCAGVEDGGADDSFELAYFGGVSDSGLPQLTVQFTGDRYANTGDHSAVNVLWLSG